MIPRALLWNSTRFLRGDQGNSSLPPTMYLNNISFTGDDRIREFARFLGSSFLTDVPNFGDTNKEIDENLLSCFHLNFSDAHVHIWNTFVLETSCEEVGRLIMELNPRKDPGPMAISANFLQYNVDVVAPMFRTGRVPSSWKKCFLIPIPKKGALNDISNYRGIAIQSCLPKILDRIITRMLYDTIGKTIKSSQHGFMRGRSTTTNLSEMTQFLHNETKKAQVDVIYFDFSKAFDQVRHDLLANKLCKLSIPYNFLRIIMKFTVGRIYILKINGQATEFFIQPESSVSQGSHFGPILYLIFTDDMNVEDMLCYADDTKIFKIIRNIEDRNALQANIDRIQDWSVSN